jgi:hypothetical protein
MLHLKSDSIVLIIRKYEEPHFQKMLLLFKEMYYGRKTYTICFFKNSERII